MPALSQPRYAGVLARHGDQVVLVREEYPPWGAAHWNIPSGRVEEHETPEQGACRELAEETGLLMAPTDLVLVATSSAVSPGKVSHAWTFTVTVENLALDVHDPDGLIGLYRKEDAVNFVVGLARSAVSTDRTRGQGGRRRLGHHAVRHPGLRPWPISGSSPNCTRGTGPRSR